MDEDGVLAEYLPFFCSNEEDEEFLRIHQD